MTEVRDPWPVSRRHVIQGPIPKINGLVSPEALSVDRSTFPTDPPTNYYRPVSFRSSNSSLENSLCLPTTLSSPFNDRVTGIACLQLFSNSPLCLAKLFLFPIAPIYSPPLATRRIIRNTDSLRTSYINILLNRRSVASCDH